MAEELEIGKNASTMPVKGEELMLPQILNANARMKGGKSLAMVC